MNPNFDGTYAEYQEYVKLFLSAEQASEKYDEETVKRTWAQGSDGTQATLNCMYPSGNK